MAPIGFSAMHGVNSPPFPLNLLLSGVTKTSTDDLTKLLLQNNTLIADEFFFSFDVIFRRKTKTKKKQVDEVSKKQKFKIGLNFIFTVIIHLVTFNSVKALTITSAYSKAANWQDGGFIFGLKFGFHTNGIEFCRLSNMKLMHLA